jgi:hypothetical protein
MSGISRLIAKELSSALGLVDDAAPAATKAVKEAPEQLSLDLGDIPTKKPSLMSKPSVEVAEDTVEEFEIKPAMVEGATEEVELKPQADTQLSFSFTPDEPQKTRKAYKLFVQRNDKLFPLFVNARKEVPTDRWLEADFPDVAFEGFTEAGNKGWYVPTKGAERNPDQYFLEGKEITKREYNKLGPNAKAAAEFVPGEKSKSTGVQIIIPDEATREKLIKEGFITAKAGRSEKAPYGKVTAVAARPGWHASVNPVAEHLGPQDIKITKEEAQKLIQAGINPKAIRTRGDQYYVKRRAEDQVWVEVDMADDTSADLLAYMQERGRTDINDKVPKGGSYSYVDGQADGETWVVAGDMRISKILSREEAKAMQEAAGVKDLPYRSEVEEILGRKVT